MPTPQKQSEPPNPTKLADTTPEDHRYVYWVALVAALGGFLFGYDLSIIGGAILYLKDVFQLNDLQEGFAMGSAVIGCMLGPFFVSWLGDTFGRKKTLFLAAILFGISAVGTALPRTIGEFNFYRAVGGAGVALASVIAPMYIAEIAPAKMRGRLVAINQLAIVGGSFAAVLVSYWLAMSSIDECWRWMFASECVPVAMMMAGLLLVPESPRWLLEKGRAAEAAQIMARIEGPNNVESLTLAAQQSLEAQGEEHSGSYGELLSRALRPALIVAIGLAVFQQITGASILFANAPIVFEKAGFHAASDAIWQTVILQVWNILCTVASMWLVDRIGRRPLLLVGLAGMTIGQIFTGVAFEQGWTGRSVLLMLLLTIGAYIISLAPLAWLIMSELFPTRLRGKGMAVASLTLWLAYFVGLQLFPLMRGYFYDNFGSIAGVFYSFAVICSVALVFCWKLVPETKGRTLEEIAAG